MVGFSDVIAVIGITITAICAAMLVFAGVDYAFEKNVSCPAFGASVDRPVKFNFLAGGCFVQDRQGVWVSTDNYWNNAAVQR